MRGLDLEDPANEPDLDKDKFLEMSVSPYKAPDAATEVSVDFEAGVPVAVNGEKMKVSRSSRSSTSSAAQTASAFSTSSRTGSSA